MYVRASDNRAPQNNHPDPPAKDAMGFACSFGGAPVMR